MATKLSEAQNLDSIQVQEQASVGTTPASGFGKVVGLSDGTFHYVNDTGTDFDLTSTTASNIALDDATELTISAGSITRTQTYHSVDTEADAASDDLDSINGGSAGDMVTIFAVSDARTVVVKNGTGNILTYSGNDISLDEDHKLVSFLYDGTNWREIGNVNEGSGSGAPSSAQYLTLATDAGLSAERVFTPQSGIAATDGGPGGNYTVSANIGSGTIKTISSGVISTGTDRNIIVAAESSTADDLIEVTGLSVGDEVYLRADTGDTITVKHNDAGATIKILLYGDADVTLDEDSPLRLIYVDTNVLAEAVDQNSGGGGGSASMIYVRDRKTSGTDSGSSTAGTQTRDLNELHDPDATGAVSLASNQLTFTAGTYHIEWAGSAYTSGSHQTFLYDVTNAQVLLDDNSDKALGESSLAIVGDNGFSPSRGACQVTFASSTDIELRHYIQNGTTGNGFGRATGNDEEIYAQVYIKVL